MASFRVSLDVNCDKLDLNTIIEKTCEECPSISVKMTPIDGSVNMFEVTLSSSSESVTSKSDAIFRNLLPANVLTSRYSPNSRQSVDTLMKYCSDNDYVRHSFDLINKSLDDYKPEEICVAFNGGKDCTALLHLVYTIFITKYPNNLLNVFFISIPDIFPLLDNFVQQSVERYNLNLISYSESNFKLALKKLNTETKIRSIFMGTRISDVPKHVMIKECQMTDPDWPQFLRICPLLDWSYGQIWCFLRDNRVPYCSLYDCGYTSIGSTNNTTPNPLLKFISHSGCTYYWPAFMLTNEDQERNGRTH
ncbi:FAD synthase-like [Oppia nitens]|uniref:FAD synthase-like n=1 Tax=Oppia nitens TaxID=1686743 RepID=UPI0023DA04BB|nr:FAD synthase-like [Oppia nitens]XP_054164463.1 FAD synthase-like [Oppia nitens]